MFGVGVLLILYGVAKFNTEPAGMYANYWGGQVFAPFVILVGGIAVLGAFVGKSARPVLGSHDKAVEFPHETVEKAWRG